MSDGAMEMGERGGSGAGDEEEGGGTEVGMGVLRR